MLIIFQAVLELWHLHNFGIMIFIWTEIVLPAGILNKNLTRTSKKQRPVKALVVAISTLLIENVLQYLAS